MRRNRVGSAFWAMSSPKNLSTTPMSKASSASGGTSMGTRIVHGIGRRMACRIVPQALAA